MKPFRFKKLDAFATADSDGNPAGMISIDSLDEITAAEMQRIARELRGFVNEVGFVLNRTMSGAARTSSKLIGRQEAGALPQVLFGGGAVSRIEGSYFLQ